jgi:hypothetical protein
MLAGVLKDIDTQITELEVIIKEKERCVTAATAVPLHPLSSMIYIFHCNSFVFVEFYCTMRGDF